jgi:hypothetical protein
MGVWRHPAICVGIAKTGVMVSWSLGLEGPVKPVARPMVLPIFQVLPSPPPDQTDSSNG